MHMLKGDNINEIQIALFNLLKTNGEEVFVRSLNTIELSPVIVHLTNIRNRCTTLVERNWNIVFAIGEFAWHFCGSDELSHIRYYSKNWDSVSDGNKIRESCYGAKIFNQTRDWENLISELKQDRNSRRAVISLYSSKDTLGLNKPDVSCTLNLQFLLRRKKLDLIATMRSNDIVWGLPNDVFFCTMLQEYLSNLLSVEVGEYYHQVASMHIYERHYNLLNKITANPDYFNFTMPKMDSVRDVKVFLDAEKKIRQNMIESTDSVLSSYWQEFIDILKLHSPHIKANERHRILQQSFYKEVIKLCPPIYVSS